MIEQFAIAGTGVVAIWLSQDARPAWRRWACVFGLCGQPFWFYAAWTAGQYGIFALCVFYTLSWARGVKTHWLGRA
jgi:nicotinamide riboside transporter PnuC